MEIYHVYGSLGQISNTENNNLTYGKDLTISDINIMKNNIKIVEEINEINTKIENSIENAEKIFFLGFSFDKINLDRVGFFNKVSFPTKIYATTLGLNRRFVNELKIKMHERFIETMKGKKEEHHIHRLNEFIVLENMNSLQLLESYL